MAEFDEKLNSILGNHEAMEQIMSLARSLSGGGGQPNEKGPSAPGGSASPPEKPPCSGDDSEPQSAASASIPDLSALLGQIDPSMLQMGMRLFQEYQGNDGRNAALLSALRPFLKEDRRAKLDRALEIARVTRLIRVALGTIGGKGEEGRV
ncbi:MAG: hypothetical protein AB7E30_07590 [Lawsonibacter sp.]